jgi:glycosyltransferase involved in cell wall biosynthesis
MENNNLDINSTTLPMVSIMMCAYNRAHYLPQAIESVLMQNYKGWELLVLDDASIDNTAEVMKSYANEPRIRYMKHLQNKGLAENRNFGLKESKGEYVAILDSDDYWTDTNKLTSQVNFLSQNKEYGLIGTYGKTVNEKDEVISNLNYEVEDKKIRKKILFYHQFLHSSVIFVKKLMTEAGGYNEAFAPAEDYDLILHIGKKHKMKNLSESMVNYRIHAGNSSSNEKEKRIKHAKLHLNIIKKYKKDYPNYLPAYVKGYCRIIYRKLGF